MYSEVKFIIIQNISSANESNNFLKVSIM